MNRKKDRNSGAITYAMDKLTDAINSLDIDEPPLKSWSEIVRDTKIPGVTVPIDWKDPEKKD